ncbi:MAG TPA: hypothetical protein VHV77_06810 [Pirellulales bacterium]|nr:hypothetical protein [Pirellulales bacterium]
MEEHVIVDCRAGARSRVQDRWKRPIIESLSKISGKSLKRFPHWGSQFGQWRSQGIAFFSIPSLSY